MKIEFLSIRYRINVNKKSEKVLKMCEVLKKHPDAPREFSVPGE